MTSFSGVTLVLFCFVFVFMLSLKPRPFVKSFFDIMQVPRWPYLFLLLFFLFVIWRCPLFRVCFCTIAVFSLYGEYVVRFPFGWCFCTLRPRAGFFTQAYVRIQPIKSTTVNVSVQYNGGLLLDTVLLTQCYYHRGTRLNVMKRFLSLQPMIPPKHFDIFPL